MIKNFESINELYTFFVPNLIKPEKKNKHTLFSGIQLDRSGWHVRIFPGRTTEGIQLWFSQYPYMKSRWASYVDKYTDPS